MKKYINIIIFLIIFIVFTILMKPSTDVLNSSANNIVDFELLWNYNNYQTVMSSWSAQEIYAAKANTFFDFGWLIGYGGLIFSLNYLLMQKVQNKQKTIISSAVFAAIFAVSLDIIENIFLLNMLYETSMVFHFLPFIVSIVASLKFMFVFYGILVFLICLIIFLFTKHKTQNKISEQ